tara:strand:+ start:355 stop:702 length:348 start_codon:yes stop_codon:yes gene_type:complete
MQEKNLVLQWIRQCSTSQCRLIVDRINAQITELSTSRGHGEQTDLARLVATILFVECAQDLDLTPLELHGLLDDPRRQCMEAVACMALEWISRPPDPSPRFAPDRHRQTDCPHVG